MLRYLILLLCLFTAMVASGQDLPPQEPASSLISEKYEPSYLSVLELADLLGAEWAGGCMRVTWLDGAAQKVVDLRAHETANFVIATGSQADVNYILSLAAALDTAPRQIEIEAMIIEMDNQRALDIGLDWNHMLEVSNVSFQKSRHDDDDSRYESTFQENDDNSYNSKARRTFENTSEDTRLLFNSAPNLSKLIGIIQETGSGKVRYTPRLRTLNNRTGTLMDGQRTTFVTRVSAATNTYETQTMDAGLKLSVTPSLGQAGYLTLHVIAELTQLDPNLDFSGSPVKSGQMLENTIIVAEGQSVVLGGFNRVEKRKHTKRVPILGHILPWIFSRDYETESNFDSLVVLTAKIVELDAPLDDRAMKILIDPEVEQ